MFLTLDSLARQKIVSRNRNVFHRELILIFSQGLQDSHLYLRPQWFYAFQGFLELLRWKALTSDFA